MRSPFAPWSRPRLNIPSPLGQTLLFVLSVVSVCLAQTTGTDVHVAVHADKSAGSLAPIWSFFGYDEPNYTYGPNGRKLLAELSALSPAPVYARTHNLLTTGDGSASLKWGSTNVYTEDAAGNPIYSWKILDKIFDTYRDANIKPLVEIGFMPEALSVRPHPYRHSWPSGPSARGRRPRALPGTATSTPRPRASPRTWRLPRRA